MSKKKQQPARVVGGDSGTLATSELSQSLDQLQYEANSWAEQVEQYAHRAVDAAIECGRRLVAVKARLGHGKWSHWLGQSFDYDQRTAERYMSLAEYAGAIANQPTITRALAVIADLREEERAAEGKPSRRRPEPVATAEDTAQQAFDRVYGAEALGRHIDATDPDEAEESDPDEQPERDEQPRPSVAKVSEASRKPERPEPIRIPPPQLLPLEDADDDEPVEFAGGLMIGGTLHMCRGPVDFEVEVDRLYWIGFDGIEQESDPLQLLQYILNLVSEEMPERRAAVVAALRTVINELTGD
ncbi:MAG: DUF3102 domain-containing protein [Alphaproteobacteria bacterium]